MRRRKERERKSEKKEGKRRENPFLDLFSAHLCLHVCAGQAIKAK
jgi:hypothetical protein